MGPRSTARRALRESALFAWAPGRRLGFGLALLLAALPALALECATSRYDETVRVAHVYDGDTVRLVDGRKVRFIGLNTPELARDAQPAEPYAEAARARLTALLGNPKVLRLRYDAERQDRYGRVLAHPFLPDGVNLTAALVKEGLGTRLSVPPNLWQAGCYRAVEDQARAARRGIWSHTLYQPLPATALAADARGFRLVSGQVQRVGQSRSSIYLDLTDRVSLRIRRADLEHFPGLRAADLKGRRVTARGWLQPREGKLYMRLQHEYDLEILD